jgi:hypothetical protein
MVKDSEYGGGIIFMYENRRMKSVGIALRYGRGERGRMLVGINLRYIVSICKFPCTTIIC